MATLILRRLRRCKSGQDVIEMALVTPLLLLLVMGIVDFGFMFMRFVVLTNAAVEGARVATLPGYLAADARARAQAYATNGGVTGAVTRHRRQRDAARRGRRHLAGRDRDGAARLHATNT